MARRADHQQFVTVKEAADLLHFSPRRVSQLLKEGRMHGVKPGGRKWVIPRIEIDRLLGHQSMTHRPDADVNNVDFRSLQEHRNELMPALLDVSGIGQLAVHDYDLAVWYFKPDDPCWPIAKGKVCRNRARVLTVELDSEEMLEWNYLKQHLDGDPVWDAVNVWKQAMADDISARLKLLQVMIERVQRPQEEGGVGLPVHQKVGDSETSEPAVSGYFAFTIFAHVLSRSLGLRHVPLRRDVFRSEAPNMTHLGGNTIAFSANQSDHERAVGWLLKSQEELVSLREAKASAEAYHRAESEASKLKRHVDRVRLSGAFPQGGVCDACRERAI